VATSKIGLGYTRYADVIPGGYPERLELDTTLNGNCDIVDYQVGSVSASFEQLSGTFLQTSSSFVTVSGAYVAFEASASVNISYLNDCANNISASIGAIGDLSNLSASVIQLNEDFIELSSSFYAIDGDYQTLSGSYWSLSASLWSISGAFLNVSSSYDTHLKEYVVTSGTLSSSLNRLWGTFSQTSSSFVTVSNSYGQLSSSFVQYSSTLDTRIQYIQPTGFINDASKIWYPHSSSTELFHHLPTVSHTLTHIWSSNSVHGFEVTDNNNGTVDIADGDIFIRDVDTESPLGNLTEYHVDATASISLTDNAVTYFYVSYNAGSPVVLTTQDYTTITGRANFLLHVMTRVGNEIHLLANGVSANDYSRKDINRLRERDWISRTYGAVTSEVGTRNLYVTAGRFHFGVQPHNTEVVDTSGTGSFTYIYRSATPNVYVRVTGSTTIDNANYDDGTGVLKALDNKKFGVNWIYMCAGDSKLYSVYGQAQYNNATDAGAASPPLAGPPEVTTRGTNVLIARVIVKKGQATLYSVTNPWTSQYAYVAASTHNGLAGLQGGNGDEYYHLSLEQHTHLLTISSSYNQLSSSFVTVSSSYNQLSATLATRWDVAITADENLAARRFVRRTNTGVSYAQANASNSSSYVIGVTLAAANAGQPAYIQTNGLTLCDFGTDPNVPSIAYLSAATAGRAAMSSSAATGDNQKLRLGQVINANGGSSGLATVNLQIEMMPLPSDGLS
jgi:hypothetical protein